MRIAGIAFLVAAFCLPGCGGGKPGSDASPAPRAAGKRVVTVYTPHGDLGIDAKAAFEAKYPDIQVEMLDMGGALILPKLRAEKDRPACDVWWGGAPGDFKRAEAEGLLEPYTPEWAAKLPGYAKSPSGAWHATYLTPEVIMYNEKKLARDEVPDTWDGLLDEEWKGRIVIRDVRPSATMKTIFGALVWREWKRTGNLDEGFAFLEKLHVHTGKYAANPEVLFSLLAAEDSPYALTLWNMPDALGRKHNHKLPFAYKIPKDSPAPVEPIALVKGGPHPEEAKLFYDFVSSEEALLRHATKFFRLPARTDLPKEKLPEWMRGFDMQPMDLDWAELEKHQEAWILRWQTQVRAKE